MKKEFLQDVVTALKAMWCSMLSGIWRATKFLIGMTAFIGAIATLVWGMMYYGAITFGLMTVISIGSWFFVELHIARLGRESEELEGDHHE